MSETIVIRERVVKRGDVSLVSRALDVVRSYVTTPISLKDPALAKLFGEGYQTAAGVVVTPANAFTFSAVYDAVNQGSADIGKLPLDLLKRREGGGSDPYTRSKTYRLLKHEANPDMGAMEFRRTLQAHAMTMKGGFAEIERDGAGAPAALWPLTPERVEPFIETSTLPNGRLRSKLRYAVDGNRKDALAAKDVIHIHGLGYDGYLGYPVIDKARQAIGIALAAQKFAGAFFGNNSNFGGVLAADDLDEEQAAAVGERIATTHSGVDKAWKLLVLGAGFKYFRTGVTPVESGMDATRSRQVEEVARFFNFPLHKLKSLDRATNNNIEHQGLEYRAGFLLDWTTLWEQELNRKLISPLEVSQQYIKHNLNVFLRADTKTRYDSYALMLDRGVFCADDVLFLEDLNPQPNGQGKIFLVQGAMVPKHKLEAIADANIKKAEAKSQPPAPPAAPKTQADAEAANARADAAEQLAAEQRALADRERDARVAAEAAGTATAGELQESRAAEQAARDRAVVIQATADDLRAQHATAECAREALAVQLAEATEARDEALSAADQARADAALADNQLQEAERRLSIADDRLAEAQRGVESAEQRAAEALAQIETSGTGRADAEAASAHAAQLAADARAQVEQLEATRAGLAGELLAARTAAEEARVDAARLLDEARARTADAEARADAAEAARQEATQQVEVSQAAVAQATADLTEAVARANQVRADAETRLAEATAAAADAAARLATAEELLSAERQCASNREAEVGQHLTALTAERDAARLLAETQRGLAEELERSVTDARAQLATITSALADVRGTSETSLTALQAAVQALERERDDARSLAARHEAAVVESGQRITYVETEILTLRQADVDAMSSVIAAHRGLFVDIMRRMVERETDRARRAQVTTEKLRHWLDTFYEGHADLMRTALLPAVRVHLAFIRSTEDPIEATRRLVDTHVTESARQIRTVLDDDADALAASLPALLYRWDTERPTAIADRLMQKELDYARRL